MSTILAGGTTTTLDALSVAGATSIGGALTLGALPTLTAVQSMVRLNTANGYGSTNTKIRRFTNTVTNQGSDITYTDSATLGASFTINTNGVYAVSYIDCGSAAMDLGLSLNSSQLTTNIQSITIADILSEVTTQGSGFGSAAPFTGYLAAGSVIRPHTDGGAVGSRPVTFTITRVS